MEPLRVTATLETGQVATFDGNLPLDGILAAAWMRRYHPDVFWTGALNRMGEGWIEAELPLERRVSNGEWYWASSFARYRQLSEEITYWHKRFDDDMDSFLDLGGRSGKINTKSGPYKSYRMPLVYMVTPELVWYALGERKEVASLLDMIPAVGKKHSAGYGFVASWTVEPWPVDLSCRDERGEPMRAIPTRDGPFECGVRPPYWHPVNRVRCEMPAPWGGTEEWEKAR